MLSLILEFCRIRESRQILQLCQVPELSHSEQIFSNGDGGGGAFVERLMRGVRVDLVCRSENRAKLRNQIEEIQDRHFEERLYVLLRPFYLRHCW